MVSIWLSERLCLANKIVQTKHAESTMAKTGLAQDKRFQQHDTGPDHPERPQRLEAIEQRLGESGLTEKCIPIEPVTIDLKLVHQVHEAAYIARAESACRNNKPFLDTPDSAICSDSFDIACLASGTVIRAVDMVMEKEIDNAFCAVRPPGHHAESGLSMGFCMFNNIAIAAQHLLDKHQLSRVLILDWDVHHGNGTQHIFESDPRVLFISLHGHPSVVYPGTGQESEIGKDAGKGFTLNIPMTPPSSDEIYRKAFDEKVLPLANKFAPEFVLISAGFDAHHLDPLAPISLETESFGWMTDRMLNIAKLSAQGRLVSVLEGGYHLDALGDSVACHVERLISATAS